jgi:trans-2,3-dihydro-3-hydroxyanthranilate isomerase
VLWDVSLSDAARRQVPQLTGASHAVFVSGGDGGGASLRFFTATGELPACGHGTVAALAFLAAETGRPECEVTLRAAGRVFAGRATPGEHGGFAEFDPGEVQIREAQLEDYDGVLAALGCDSEGLAGELCLASAGRARLLVPMGDPCALAQVRPDFDRLRDACDRLGLLGCYVHSLPSAGGRLTARMFAPSIGVPEDIANANSTACLAARLAQRGLRQISVDMGDSLNRPATITATARETGSAVQIRVGGAARVTETAWLKLPRVPAAS